MNSKNITLGGFHLRAGAKMCSDRERKNEVKAGHEGFSNIYTRARLWMHAHVFSVATSTHPPAALPAAIYLHIYLFKCQLTSVSSAALQFQHFI